MACIQDSGTTINQAYAITLPLTPTSGAFTATNPPGRDQTSSVELDKMSGGSSAPIAPSMGMSNPVIVDVKSGTIAPTTDIVENVWYRVILSVKLVTDQNQKTTAIIAGKVFADGQLEPFAWTVGPLTDTSGPLSSQ